MDAGYQTLEDRIHAIWREVLGAPNINRYENFFEAGGTSILASRLAARLRVGVSEDVIVSDIFLYPTISSLSERLGGSPDAVSPTPLNTRAERQSLAYARMRTVRAKRMEVAVHER